MKKPDYFTLTAANELSKSIELPDLPENPSKVIVDVFSGGGVMRYGVDFALIGRTLIWSSGPFDGLLTENDEIRVSYF